MTIHNKIYMAIMQLITVRSRYHTVSLVLIQYNTFLFLKVSISIRSVFSWPPIGTFTLRNLCRKKVLEKYLIFDFLITCAGNRCNISARLIIQNFDRLIDYY